LKDSNDNLEANTDRREAEYYFNDNYTIYKNAGFWLANSRDIFSQIQALHCEFAEFLLHVGVFA
jgi:hypothetical protein